MPKRIEKDKKTKCIASLCFSIPLRFSICMTPKDWEEYKKDCEYLGFSNPLLRLKREFFKVFNVENSQDTIYADDEVKKKYSDLINEYIKCLGVDQNKFVNWVMIDKNKIHMIAEEKRKNEK